MQKKIIIFSLALLIVFLNFQNELAPRSNGFNSKDLITEMQKPVYPKYAVANEKEGLVSLIVIVKPTGKVEYMFFEEYTGTNEIDEIAKKTIENKWSFSEYKDKYAYKIDFSFNIVSDEVPEVSCNVLGPKEPDKLIKKLDFTDMVMVASPELIENKIKKGVDISARYEGGITPLMLAAAFNDDPEVIKKMAESNANINARDKKGFTPLLMAIKWTENSKAVEALLELGAKVNVRDDGAFKYSSLEWAVWRENLKITEMLLEAEAEINVSNRTTPLRLALRSENIDIDLVKMLLQAGTDPNLKSGFFNRTPLMYLAQKSEDPEVAKEIVNLFIDYGVDGSLTCRDEKTAFDYAVENEKLKNTKVYWRLNDIRW